MNFEPAPGRDAFVISGIGIEGAAPDGSELVLSEVCWLSCKCCNPFLTWFLTPSVAYSESATGHSRVQSEVGKQRRRPRRPRQRTAVL